MKRRHPKRRWKKWRWRLWTQPWSAKPFYSALEQRAFDRELARIKARNNVALTVGRIAYGLR